MLQISAANRTAILFATETPLVFPLGFFFWALLPIPSLSQNSLVVVKAKDGFKNVSISKS